MAEDVMAKLHRVAAADRAKQAAAAKKAATRSTRTTARQQSKPVTVRPSGTTGGAGGSGGTQAGTGYSSNHDCGPWIEASSSRVAEYRYDYGNGQLQVRWTNSRGKHGDQTIYQCGDEDTGKGGTNVYRAFAQAVSKGKYVNSTLNGIPFWPGDDASFDAPSNPNRNEVRHKL